MPGSAYSPRRVYWASQETISDWDFASATGTAGSFDIATDGNLVCGAPSRGQTLIWSTTDLWTMTYIGGTLLYSFAQVGKNCGIVGDRAAVVLDTGAYWMGFGKFHVYDGFVRTLPCEVEDYVFGSFNAATADSAVWALANPQFNEVTWFYPSTGQTTADRYVTFNFVENHWAFGLLSRAAGVTRQAGATPQVPVMITAAGVVYDHETGNARTGGSVYLASGPMEIADGDNVVRVQSVVPDDVTAGDVTATLYTSLYPDAAETANGPYTLTSPTSVRVTARQVRVHLVEAAAHAWRVGVIRLGGILGGRR